MGNSKALLGAGCFWGVEEFFREIYGISDTKVGYAGGNFPNPTYQDVCSDNTGHAEVVRIEFDSTIVSYQKILDHFWLCHDPTQLNRQGPDVGTQYRSVIFYLTDEQKTKVEDAVSSVRSALQADDSGELNVSLTELQSIIQEVGQAVYANQATGPSDTGVTDDQEQSTDDSDSENKSKDDTIEGDFKEV